MLNFYRTNEIYTKKSIKHQSASLCLDDFRMGMQENEGSLTTIYDYKQLSSKLNKFFQMFDTTVEQKKIILHISKKLSELNNPPDITVSEGPEDETIISFQSDKGIHLLAISTDGDTMVSFSGFRFKDGWRKFYSYEEIDSEKITYDFLTTVREQNQN